jgi:hypothetical protein
MFLMTGSVKSKLASEDSSLFGLALMLGYLGFDGFTSTFQDKLFKASREREGGGDAEAQIALNSYAKQRCSAGMQCMLRTVERVACIACLHPPFNG